MRILVSEVEKFARLWHVGTFIGTLAGKNEKLARFWHVGMWSRKPRWQAWHAWHAI